MIILEKTGQAAAALYTLAAAAYPAGSPWTAAQFEADLKNPQTLYIAAVADDGTLVAFLGCRYLFDEGEITNLAVLPEYRRQRLGKRLLGALFECLLQKEPQFTVFLEVRNSNLSAQKLYSGQGFEVIGRRKQYYQHPTEDALIMRRVLPVEKKE